MIDTFESYLQKEFIEENPEILDDDMPDAYDAWLERNDDRILDMADRAFRNFEFDIRQIVIEDVPHQYQERLLKILK
jgi:hypothetical protein